jgi:hypothetical protein
LGWRRGRIFFGSRQSAAFAREESLVGAALVAASVDFAAGAESDLAVPSEVGELDALSPDFAVTGSFLSALAAADRASLKSFFANPLPLKTIAGVENSLRMVPPHRSQAVGPGSFMPWRTSTLWPQLRHS